MTESLTFHPEPLAPGVLLAPRPPATGARTTSADSASGAVGALYTLLERMGLVGPGSRGRE